MQQPDPDEDAIACLMMAEKDPKKVPVVVHVAPGKQYAWTLGKHRFLVPEDFSYPKFLHFLRRQIRLAPSEAIFGTLEGDMPQQRVSMSGCNLTMGDLRRLHAPKRRYMVLTIDGESVFGS